MVRDRACSFFFFREQADYDFIQVSYFSVELVVGICMFAIVAWLLLFRLNEIIECWKSHRRIRYYFGLTLVGTAVNLSVGIIGLSTSSARSECRQEEHCTRTRKCYVDRLSILNNEGSFRCLVSNPG